MRRWQDSSTRPNLALSDQGPAQAPGTRSRVQALLRAAPRILCHGHGFDDCGLSGQRVLQLMIVAVGVTPLDLDGRALAAEKAPRQIVRHSAAVRDTVKTLHRRGYTAGTNIRLIGLAERCRPIQRAQSGSPAAGPAGSKSCARPARPTSHRPRPHRGRHPTPTASEMAQGYRRATSSRTPPASPGRDQRGSRVSLDHTPESRSSPPRRSAQTPWPKLALGIADNQVLTCCVRTSPTCPWSPSPDHAAHAWQPAWPDHLSRLRSAGVGLIYGDDVWPLTEPHQPASRELPWSAIISSAFCRTADSGSSQSRARLRLAKPAAVCVLVRSLRAGLQDSPHPRN
jgi:hypothetical protein